MVRNIFFVAIRGRYPSELGGDCTTTLLLGKCYSNKEVVWCDGMEYCVAKPLRCRYSRRATTWERDSFILSQFVQFLHGFQGEIHGLNGCTQVKGPQLGHPVVNEQLIVYITH